LFKKIRLYLSSSFFVSVLYALIFMIDNSGNVFFSFCGFYSNPDQC